MTTQTEVVERVPTWELAAPDGAVRLFAPTDPSQPWQSQVWRAGTPKSVEVCWSRVRGYPSRYVCDQHGLSDRRDHCPHVIAALAAWRLYDERTRHDP